MIKESLDHFCGVRAQELQQQKEQKPHQHCYSSITEQLYMNSPAAQSYTGISESSCGS